MDKKHGRGAESSSSVDCTTQKRSRLDSENPLPLPYSGLLNEIVPEISDRFEEAGDIVLSGAADKETINELVLRLKEARVSTQMALATNHMLLNKHSEMREKINDLTNRNAILGDKIARLYNDATKEKSKRSAIEKVVDLQKVDLQKANNSIAELTSQKTALWEELRKLFSKVSCINRLEEELKAVRLMAAQLEKPSISPKNCNSSMRKEGCDNVESTRPQTSGKYRNLTLKVEGFEPIRCRVPSEPLQNHDLQETEVSIQSELSNGESHEIGEMQTEEPQDMSLNTCKEFTLKVDGFAPIKYSVPSGHLQDHHLQKTEVSQAQSVLSNGESHGLEEMYTEDLQKKQAIPLKGSCKEYVNEGNVMQYGIAPAPLEEEHHHLMKEIDDLQTQSVLSRKEPVELEGIQGREEENAGDSSSDSWVQEEEEAAQANVATDYQAYSGDQMDQDDQDYRIVYAGYY